jgi:epoxyqueuosine reductase
VRPDYAAIVEHAAREKLEIFGAFHVSDTDGAPAGAQTLLLLGPAEPGFWAHVTMSEEFRDGRPDPIDRWSWRVIGHMACDLGAKALFPFGGPPWHPFIAWAKRSGRAWESPVGFLVHDKAGLMVSYRGALALKEWIDLPDAPVAAPCTDCPAPCTTACPVNALSPKGYDAAACHSYLGNDPGTACIQLGCAVRRACPLSESYGRLPQQSAYHMRQFHP